MASKKFYRCKHCGNLFEVMVDANVVPTCCGEPMEVLTANTSDGATEKHVPAVTRNGKVLDVQVGSVAHPMEEAHHIAWIAVVQNGKTQHVDLVVGNAPVASFTVDSATDPVEVYEFCNLHGLWIANA